MYVCIILMYVCIHVHTHNNMIMIMTMTTTLAHHHIISFGVCIIIMQGTGGAKRKYNLSCALKYVIVRHSLSYTTIHTHTHTRTIHTYKHTYIYLYVQMGTQTHTNTCRIKTFPSLPRTLTLSKPAVAWYLPASHLVQFAAPAKEYVPPTQ
jgi:hypothetical protein